MNPTHARIVDDVKAAIQAEGGVVTDIVGMVRFIDGDGHERSLFLMDGSNKDGQGNVVVIAGMVRALDTYIDPYLRANFGG